MIELCCPPFSYSYAVICVPDCNNSVLGMDLFWEKICTCHFDLSQVATGKLLCGLQVRQENRWKTTKMIGILWLPHSGTENPFLPR